MMSNSTQTFKLRPLIVGLTGGIGSGKTAVSDQLHGLGIDIVDADIVAREVVEPGTSALSAIAEHFGADVITDQGELDRAALRSRVFKAPDDRKWLEQLLHPIIRQTIVERLAQPSHQPYRVLASPLLLETDQHTLVDTIVVVDIEKHQQLERASKRDANSVSQVEAIIAAQIDRDTRLEKADFVVDNRGSFAELAAKVNTLHEQLCEASKA